MGNDALRTALWRYLLSVPMPSDEALTAISRVDVVITIAATAALRGYHRSDMAATSALIGVWRAARELGIFGFYQTERAVTCVLVTLRGS